jgi:hypothetical protein
MDKKLNKLEDQLSPVPRGFREKGKRINDIKKVIDGYFKMI